MAEIGHWSSLTEAEKLTQAAKISGVIEQDIKKGGLFYGDPAYTAAGQQAYPMLPLSQWSGLRIEWVREDDVTDAENVDIGAQLEWSDDDTGTEKNSKLRVIYKQSRLDNYVESIYGTYNNYEEIQFARLAKACVRKLEKDIIYGDNTYTSSIQMDGMHAIAAENTGTDLDIDEGEGALSLYNLRTMIAAMEYGVDVLLMPRVLRLRFDQMAQESALKTGYQWGINQFGVRMPMWDDIPIVESTYMVAEQANTGVGSDARAAHSSGTANYSIFGIKFGQVTNREPGLSLGFGGEGRDVGQIFRTVRFVDLPDYDASGVRLVGYSALAPGSKYAVGRIYDITNAAITA